MNRASQNKKKTTAKEISYHRKIMDSYRPKCTSGLDCYPTFLPLPHTYERVREHFGKDLAEVITCDLRKLNKYRENLRKL